MKAALYARTSTHDQQTLALHIIVLPICRSTSENDTGRNSILRAARKREIDMILVWKLDRWGRSLLDLMNSLQELTSLHVGFVSLTEAIDFTTPPGKTGRLFLAG